MKNEKYKYQILYRPKTKIKFNSLNPYRHYNNKNTQLSFTLNDKEKKNKKESINFLSNDTPVKTYFKTNIISSPIKTPKNSILNNYKINIKLNNKMKNFINESNRHKSVNNTLNNFTLKKYNKNLISSLKSNKTLIKNDDNNNDSYYNLYEINKENKNILNNFSNRIRNQRIIYPYFFHDRKNKQISLKKNIKFKNKLIISTKENNIKNFFSDKKNNNKKIYNSIDNKNNTQVNFVNYSFPTLITEIKGNKGKNNNENHNDQKDKKENNYYLFQKRIKKNSLMKLTKKKNFSFDKNKNIIFSKFKEYKRQIEPNFSFMEKVANNITKDIIKNPFMRKIENLNDLNKFEIVFHRSIMDNILEIKQKAKNGFFQGNCWTTTLNKDKETGSYVSENKANVYNISEMIDKMSPVSCLKFKNILIKDYKEFLEYNKKNLKKKKLKKEDELRKKLIKRYNKELFFENHIAEKYKIKKNSGIKFIQDDEENNKDDKLY